MAQGYTGAHFIDFTKFLLLAGRTGTTNNPTISTTTDGTILGSTAANGILVGSSASGAFNLKLRANSNTPAQATITFVDNLTALGANQPVALTVTPSLTLDNAASSFMGLNVAGTWLFTANAAGSSGAAYSPVLQNSPSGTGRTVGQIQGFNSNIAVQPQGSATLTFTAIQSFSDSATFSTSATALCTVTQYTSFLSSISSGANGLTLTTRRGLFVQALAAGATITTEVGVDVEALTGTAAVSLRSLGTSVEMRHAGPARFGATGAVTSGTTLDLQGGFTGKVTNGGDTTYTILTSDYIIIAPISTARTYNLPTIASAGVGKVYILIHTGATTAVLTVARASADTINNAATTYAPTGTVYRLYYIVAVTTTNWAIVSTIP